MTRKLPKNYLDIDDYHSPDTSTIQKYNKDKLDLSIIDTNDIDNINNYKATLPGDEYYVEANIKSMKPLQKSED